MGRGRERRWEEALAAKRQVEEDFARFNADQGREMSAADRERIRALAADVPALWSSTTTGVADRREVVRLLVERVELTRRGETEGIGVAVHWRGGAVSRHAVRQRVRGDAHLGRAALRARLVERRGSWQSGRQIADALNADGFAMPRGDAFTADTVRACAGRSGGPSDRQPPRTANRGRASGGCRRWRPSRASPGVCWTGGGGTDASRPGDGPAPGRSKGCGRRYLNCQSRDPPDGYTGTGPEEVPYPTVFERYTVAAYRSHQLPN